MSKFTIKSAAFLLKRVVDKGKNTIALFGLAGVVIRRKLVWSSCLKLNAYSLEASLHFYSLSARDFADCQLNKSMQPNAGALIPALRLEFQSSDRRVETSGNIDDDDR